MRAQQAKRRVLTMMSSQSLPPVAPPDTIRGVDRKGRMVCLSGDCGETDV